MTRARYQKGSLTLVERNGGHKAWVFRWRETGFGGKRRPRKIVVGSFRNLRTKSQAWKALEELNLPINRDLSEGSRPPFRFQELIDHYKATELSKDSGHHTFSTRDVYSRNIDNWILPRWGEYPLSRFEGDIAVHIEAWLKTLTRESGQPLAPGTKAKIRNIMSAICTHAMRYGWMQTHPIKQKVRQSARVVNEKRPFDLRELQQLYKNLALMDRLLVLLDVPTGMRVGELLALQWCDINWARKTVRIEKAVWHQEIGPTKTRDSDSVMPLDDAILSDLRAWRAQTPYAQEKDWIFASPRMKGTQPYWPDALLKHIRKAAAQAGITKHLSWHVFRHTFSTLLIENGEDVKTVQSLMRHSNSNITLSIYTHSATSRKRAAQSRVVEMMLPKETKSV